MSSRTHRCCHDWLRANRYVDQASRDDDALTRDVALMSSTELGALVSAARAVRLGDLPADLVPTLGLATRIEHLPMDDTG